MEKKLLMYFSGGKLIPLASQTSLLLSFFFLYFLSLSLNPPCLWRLIKNELQEVWVEVRHFIYQEKQSKCWSIMFCMLWIKWKNEQTKYGNLKSIIHYFKWAIFLVATKRLYMSVCPSVGSSVRPTLFRKNSQKWVKLAQIWLWNVHGKIIWIFLHPLVQTRMF